MGTDNKKLKRGPYYDQFDRAGRKAYADENRTLVDDLQNYLTKNSPDCANYFQHQTSLYNTLSADQPTSQFEEWGINTATRITADYKLSIQIQDINNSIKNLSDDYNDITNAINNINTTISDIKGSFDTFSTNVNNLTDAVNKLDDNLPNKVQQIKTLIKNETTEFENHVDQQAQKIINKIP